MTAGFGFQKRKEMRGLRTKYPKKSGTITSNSVIRALAIWFRAMSRAVLALALLGCSEHGDIFSFLMKMENMTFSEAVQELAIISPFLDKDVVALESMLTTLRPRRAVLLVQPGWTSVDLAALRKMLHRFDELAVRPFGLRGEDAYVHAKCYLLKLAGRAICLQGSPNLSQVAMLMTDPKGNIELANLLTGQRNAFDHLLDALEIEPKTKLDELDLSYQSPRTPAYRATNNWYLTGGEWQGKTLHLAFH